MHPYSLKYTHLLQEITLNIPFNYCIKLTFKIFRKYIILSNSAWSKDRCTKDTLSATYLYPTSNIKIRGKWVCKLPHL